MSKPEDVDRAAEPQSSRDRRIERDMQAADTANGERPDEGSAEREDDAAAPGHHQTGEAQARRNVADDPPA